MEELLDHVKAYILAQVNPYIAELETEGVPLAALTDATIVLGDCDIMKHAGPNVLFINPDTSTFTDLTISDYDNTLQVDFLFVCRSAATGVLYKRVLRYMAALVNLFIEDQNLGGAGVIGINTQDYFDGMEGNAAIKGCLLSCEITY